MGKGQKLLGAMEGCDLPRAGEFHSPLRAIADLKFWEQGAGEVHQVGAGQHGQICLTDSGSA